ncbi:MAG: hypothetical protein IPF71_01665 [Rhodoferax sp.]|nr:hypothetical protein [Rhodoferax sp.]
MDNFYQSAFGGSFLNHFWLTCACTPVYQNAPKDIVALDAQGRSPHPKEPEALVTQDGFAVNTMQSVWLYNPEVKQALLPPQTAPYPVGLLLGISTRAVWQQKRVKVCRAFLITTSLLWHSNVSLTALSRDKPTSKTARISWRMPRAARCHPFRSTNPQGVRLAPLGPRDAKATSLARALKF